MFGIILLVIAALCAFVFPASLIDAIRAEDAEEAKSSRTIACVTFGVLMLIIGTLMILLHW